VIFLWTWSLVVVLIAVDDNDADNSLRGVFATKNSDLKDVEVGRGAPGGIRAPTYRYI